MKFTCPRGLGSKAIILQTFAELGFTVLKKINPIGAKVSSGRPVQKAGKRKTEPEGLGLGTSFPEGQVHPLPQLQMCLPGRDGSFPEFPSPPGDNRSVSCRLSAWTPQPGVRPRHPSFLAGWPWAGHLTSLCLCFLVFQLRVIKPPTSLGCCGE